jgi:hypothetical protein
MFLLKMLALILDNYFQYFQSSSPNFKRDITLNIFEIINEKGKFLAPENNNSWYEIPYESSRQKIAHAMQYHHRCVTRLSSIPDDVTPSPCTEIDDQIFPGPLDVLFSRGRSTTSHSGNIKLQGKSILLKAYSKRINFLP